MFWVTVFNATFSNILNVFLSWRSVLFVEETGAPGKTADLSQVTDKLYHYIESYHLLDYYYENQNFAHLTLFFTFFFEKLKNIMSAFELPIFIR
jgi:hypothetical protein